MNSEDLSDGNMRACLALWPAEVKGDLVPSLLTEQELTTRHGKVLLPLPWYNSICVRYEIGALNMHYGVTMMVEDIARKATVMALKDQKCGAYFYSHESRQEPPKPISSEERQRVFSDYCVAGKFTTNQYEDTLTGTFCLYYLPRDKP
jgi:hypothetical protein